MSKVVPQKMDNYLKSLDMYFGKLTGVNGVMEKCNEILRFDYDKEDAASLPYWEICLFLYMTNVAVVVARSSPRSSSWAYDLFYTIVGGFGGGIMNPILLCMDSHFPFPMASDIVIPIVLVSWYCVHYVPYYYELVELPIIKHVVLVGFECVRAFLIQLWALRAATHIKPSYFSFPVFGPLVCGFIAGCGGFFCLLGPSGIMKMVPWPVQSAFLASLMHLLMVNGALGVPKYSFAEAHSVMIVFLVVSRLIPVKLRDFIFGSVFGAVSFITKLSNDVKPSPLKLKLNKSSKSDNNIKKKRQ